MIKTLLLTFTLSLTAMSGGFASAAVVLYVAKEGGELKIVNNKTKAGLIERGVKNHGGILYVADPGTYTMTGTNPECSVVVQSAAFEEGKSYSLGLTKDCQIKTVSF